MGIRWDKHAVWRLRARLLCVLDALLARVFALEPRWAALRLLFLLGYLAWVCIRPLWLFLKSRIFFWELVGAWVVGIGALVLAWLAASVYLWRIFDLETEAERRDLRRKQSREMVLYRALALRYEKWFSVVDGRVENETSMVYWFGGPGRVQVAMDNVVVLERTGQDKPRMVSPGAWQPVKGYERLRRILDLREQHLCFDVPLRTRDGVPLVFRDVQVVYSVQRGRKDVTPARPYPYVEESIERLIRNEGGMARDLGGDLPWANVTEWRRWRSVEHTAQAMQVAFRGRLRRAVSARTLSEVLAFIQGDEAEALFQGWAVQPLNAQPKRNLLLGPLLPYVSFPQPPADPLPRYRLTELLLRQADYEPWGVSLHWADMNDWDIMVENIKSQFIQAWQLSREAQRRVTPDALKQVRQEAFLAFLSAEIQRWDQLLSRGDLETPAGRAAFLVGVREWLTRLWVLWQEIEDRHIDLNEAEVVSFHKA